MAPALASKQVVLQAQQPAQPHSLRLLGLVRVRPLHSL
jgi:hypothetical protein